MEIAIAELEELALRVLKTRYNDDDARHICDVVMYGELSGKVSHGILRLLPENYGVFTSGIKEKPAYIKKTEVSTLIESNGNVGMLIGPLAMNEVVRLALSHGIGIVGTKGSINTTGALSYYCETIARENLICIVMSHYHPLMAAFGSKKKIFGTNPIAFGIPAKPAPFVFDMACSAMTFGDMVKYQSSGKKLPYGVAVNAAGVPTTDPGEARDGALLPFDHGYKASGLAMIVEILAAVWTGASFAGFQTEKGCGNFYMALSPELLGDAASLKSRMRECMELLQKTETRDGTPLRLPGMRTQKTVKTNRENGRIDVDETVVRKLREMIG